MSNQQASTGAEATHASSSPSTISPNASSPSLSASPVTLPYLSPSSLFSSASESNPSVSPTTAVSAAVAAASSQHTEHGEEEEDKENTTKNPMIAIVGRTADPFNKENWEDDFELDEDDDAEQESNLSSALLRMTATAPTAATNVITAGNVIHEKDNESHSISTSQVPSPSNSFRQLAKVGANTDAVDLAATAKSALNLSFPSHSNQQPDDIDDLDDLDDDDNHDFQTKSPAFSTPLTPHKQLQPQPSGSSPSSNASPPDSSRNITPPPNGNVGINADTEPDEEEDDEFEDWDAEIREEEVREAAAKGLTPEQIAQLLKTQSALVSNDHAKRHHMLNGLNEGTGRTAGGALLSSPEAGGGRKKRPPPVDEDEGLGSFMSADDEKVSKQQSAAAMRAVTANLANAARSQPFSFFSPTAQSAAPQTTVSPNDPLLASDYSLNSSISLTQLLAQNDLALAQQAAAASASSSATAGSSAAAAQAKAAAAANLLLNPKINIVMYPTPSQLLSLKTEDGLSGYNEKQLESWLKHLVTKHGSVWKMKCVPLDGELDASSLGTSISSMEPLPHLLASTLYRINHLYRQQVTLDSYRSIKGTLPTPTNTGASLPSILSQPTPAVTAWSLLVSLFTHIESRLNSATSSGSPIECLNDEPCFRLLYSLLFLGAKLWHSAPQFGNMIKISQRIFPLYAGMLQLLELETLAHHDGTKANRLMRIFVSLYKRYAATTTTTATVPAAQTAGLNLEVCAQALVSLNFYLSNLSPLTTAPLSDRASWDGKDDSNPGAFEWLDRAWAGEKPNPANSASPANHELEQLTWELCGAPEVRMNLLKDLYPKLPAISFVKARVAYAIGSYTCTTNNANAAFGSGGVSVSSVAPPPGINASASSSVAPSSPYASSQAGFEHPTKVAEKWLMECLYILDHISPFPRFPWDAANQFAQPGPVSAASVAAAAAASSTVTSVPVGAGVTTAASQALAGGAVNKSAPPTNQTRPHSSSASAAASPANASGHPSSCTGLPIIPMLSELGCNALILYGDILLSLDKYKYAILSYESALANYQYRHSLDFHSLYRRLVEITTKEEDMDRCIAYHTKILEKSQLDGNLNMYVYLVQQLSKLEVSQGHFRRSEEHLRSALNFLRPFSVSSNSRHSLSQHHDPSSHHAHTHSHHHSHHHSHAPSNSFFPPQQVPPVPGCATMWDFSSESHAKFVLIPPSEFRSATLNIFLQLSRLYLEGDRILNAIMVLEMLMRAGTSKENASGNASQSGTAKDSNTGGTSSQEGLTRSKLNQVYLLLATAYMRKKKYVKARSLLKAMEELNGLNPSASTAHYISANAEAKDTVFAITPVGPQQLTHTPHQMSISHSQHGQHTVNPSFSASRSAFAHTGRAGSVGQGASSTAVNSPISTYSTLSLLSPASSLSANSSYSPPPVAHPLSHILDQSLYNDFLALQSKIAMHSNDFLTALHFLSLSFASINPGANLGAMARLNFRRGQVLQRICLEVAKGNGSKDLERAGIVIKVSNAHHLQQQTQQQSSKQGVPPSTPNLFTPSTQHHPGSSFSSNSLNSANLVSPSAATAQQQQMAAAALSGPAIKLLVLDDSCGDGAGIVLPDPSLAVQSFYDSYSYFSLVDDSLHTTSALSQIVDTYLGIIFPPVALFDVPCTHPQIRDWLQLAGFDTTESLRAAPTEAFDKFLKTVEELCVEVTESCMSSLQILPLLTVYAQLMEIKLLQGRWRESAAFFLELKNAFYQLFIVSPLTTNKGTATQSKSKSAPTSNAPSGAASTATTSPSLSQGTFNLLLHKSTPGFTRAVYMLLKRLARMIPAFASMWRGATHEMGKDHDDAQTTGGHTRTHTAHPTTTAHAGLRARIRALDPTLVARECRAFTRSHLDVLDLLQLYETEVMNEEVAMELAMSNTHAPGDEDEHTLLSSAQAKAPPVFQSSNSSLNLSPTKSPTNAPTINVSAANNGADYTSGVSGGVYSVKSWNEQRFLVFGALGSRSLLAHHRPSLVGGELLASPFAALSVGGPSAQNSGAAMSPAQSAQHQATQRFLALGEKLCFSLSEMERAASKNRSSGTRSRGGAAEDQKLLHQKNNFILAKMQQLMKSMRKLVSGSSMSMSGSVDMGNDPIIPPIVPPSPSNASLANAAPLHASSQKLNLASMPNYPGNNAIVNAPRRLTTWVSGPYTIGAGLFSSLVYVVPLDNVLFVYSPRGHHMMLRPFMPHSGAIYNTMLYPPQLVPSPQFLDRTLRDFQRTKPMSMPRLPPPLQQKHDNNKSEHHRTINASRVEGGKSMLSLDPQTLSASPPSANNPRSLVDPTSNLQKSVHVRGHVHRRSHSLGLTLPTNTTLSPIPAEPAAPPCHVCNCDWLADHSWEEGFCRNCYHVHAAPLLAVDGHHSPDVTVVIDDDVDDEDEDEEDENEDDEEVDLEEEEEDELRELESEDEFPSLHNTDVHHTPQVRNKRSVSKKVSITRSLRGSLSSDPSIRRLVPTDADTFLPPALDLAHVRELFNSLDPQNLLLVFAAMFSECRILFVSNSNFRLMAVMNSLVKLMHPFTWQFAFIPLLTRKNANLILQQPPQSVLERQYSTRSSILGVTSVNSHSGSSNTKRTSIIGSPSASPAAIPAGFASSTSSSTPLSPFLIGVHSTLLASLLRGAPSMGDTVPSAATSSSLPPTPINAGGASAAGFNSAHPLPVPGALAPNIVQVDLDRNRVRYAAGLFVTLPPRIKFRLQKACMRFLSVCFVLETGAQAKAQAAAQAKAQRAEPVAPTAQPASAAGVNLDLPSLSRRGSANAPRMSVTSPAISPPNAVTSPPAASSSVSTSSVSNTGAGGGGGGGAGGNAAPAISSPSSPSFRHFRTTSELSRQITMQPPVLPDHLSPGERSESRPENEGSESPIAPADITVAIEPLSTPQVNDSLKSKVALVSNNASTVGAQPQPSARYLLTDLFYPPQQQGVGTSLSNSRSAGATPEKFGVEHRGSVSGASADPNAKANQALKALRDSFLSAFVSLFYRYRLFWKDAVASGQSGAEIPSSNQGGLATGMISTSAAAPSTTLVGGLASSTHAGLISASASVVPGGAPLSVRAFLEHSKQANQTFLQNFLMRTRAFKAFVFARATCPPAALLAHTTSGSSRLSSSASSSPEPASRLLEALRASPTFGFGRPNIRVHPSYKFDAIVLSTLRNKLAKIRARSLESCVCSHAHAIYFAHGSGGRRGKFQKRYLALVGNKLMVHKVPLGLLITAPISPLVTAEPEYVLYEREKGDEDLLGPVASQPSVAMSSSSASAASSFATAITTVPASSAPALIGILTSSKKLLTKPAKYIRELQPGQIKLIQPVLIEDKSIGVTSGEGNQFFTFQLIPAFISTSTTTPAAAVEPWWIRCETESECRYWMKLIESRIMEPELKQLYEKFA